MLVTSPAEMSRWRRSCRCRPVTGRVLWRRPRRRRPGMRRLGGLQATGATQAESLRRLRGARGASAHACSTGLSTGRRLMPMTARCCRAVPRQQRCMRGCGRKLSCIGMRGCGRKRKGVDENSWQSRQLHWSFQRLTVWIVQSNVCRALAGCVERTGGHASVWIAMSFACGCSCTRSVRSTQPSPSHHLSPVRQLSDSRCSAAQRGSTAPGCHGHQTTPR